MLTANQEMLELFGVKKRMADVEGIVATIEPHHKIQRTFSTTSGNCHFVSYEWGHLIVYSYPEESLMTIDIFSTKSYIFIEGLKETLISVFSPRQYLCFDQLRTAGGREYA